MNIKFGELKTFRPSSLAIFKWKLDDIWTDNRYILALGWKLKEKKKQLWNVTLFLFRWFGLHTHQLVSSNILSKHIFLLGYSSADCQNKIWTVKTTTVCVICQMNVKERLIRQEIVLKTSLMWLNYLAIVSYLTFRRIVNLEI